MKLSSLIQRRPIFLALLAVGLAGSRMAQGFTALPPTVPGPGHPVPVPVPAYTGLVTALPPSVPVYTGPVITSFAPLTATNGALIIITGTNFSATASNDIVYFGSVTATVKSATASQLVVAVPSGTILAPITVTIQGLTAASSRQFLPEFVGAGGSLGVNSFAPGFTIPTGLSPGYTVIADFDGDGRPDLADVDGYAHTITIYRNLCTNGMLSAASFAPPITLSLPPDSNNGNPFSLHAVDLDGDGKLDLLVTEISANRITIYRNTSNPGAISFAPPVFLSAGHDIRCAVAVDVDGDGRPDIVAANSADNTISVLKNLSFPGSLTTNSFAAAVNFALPGSCQDLTAGDLDGDGKPDVAVSLYAGAPGISVFRNTATLGIINSNTFAPRVDFPGFTGAVSIKMGDVDGDGKPDLVVAFINSPQCMAVYRNLSTPGIFNTNSLAPEVNFSTPGWAQGVALADFSGDGLLDLAVGGEIPDFVSIYPNLSTPGSFTSASLGTPVGLGAGYNVWGLVAGDLAGDGRPALVFTNTYDSNLEIYQNITPFAGPPVIVTQPLSQNVAQGGTVILSVTATGGDLSYQWCFNGQKLAGEAGQMLTLTDVLTSQAGDYSVKVTSPYGSTTSSNAILTVLTPPVITSEPVNQTVTNGVTVTIGVGVSGTDLSYEWLFNGMPLSAGNIITTVAGQNTLGGTYSGDGGPALVAGMNYSAWGSPNVAGNLYIADTFNFVIRKMNAQGIITTVAGNNSFGPGYSGDGGPATNADLNYPNCVIVDSSGNLFIADSHNNLVRKVDTNGIITTVAGNINLGGTYSGDGGVATNAALNFPVALTLDGAGDLFIAEYGNNVIRKVNAAGVISTVAGRYPGGGYSGDGGAATNASLSMPSGIAVDGAGNLFFSDAGHEVIRKVDTAGIITTVAGNNSLGSGYSGDGGAATSATLNNPNAVVEDGAGNLYIAEYYNNVVREVTPGGLISTFAGNYNLGGTYSGDGGAATNAGLYNPVGLALDSVGNLYIGDVHNNVIRKVSAAGYGVNPTNGALTLTSVQAAMSGNYQVIVSNPSGSVTSSIVQLTVDVPPVITSQPASQTVAEGGTLVLNVGVQGTPPLQYQWTYNGRNLAGATGASLIMTNIHPSQAGEYAVKISTPAGNITSSNALVTVIAQTMLVYSFSGQENYVAGNQSAANNYSGELIFLPTSTNGVFVAWGVVAGQRRYWVDDLGGCTMYTIAGAGSQTYTVLGQASQNTNSSDPSLWSTIYQGQNTPLPVGPRQYFSFPSLFSGAITEVYPDSATGSLVLYESNSSYVFSPQITQTANNTGETTIDLENALINSLKAQGYKN
jgi:hypothetical protein